MMGDIPHEHAAMNRADISRLRITHHVRTLFTTLSIIVLNLFD